MRTCRTVWRPRLDKVSVQVHASQMFPVHILPSIYDVSYIIREFQNQNLQCQPEKKLKTTSNYRFTFRIIADNMIITKNQIIIWILFKNHSRKLVFLILVHSVYLFLKIYIQTTNPRRTMVAIFYAFDALWAGARSIHAYFHQFDCRPPENSPRFTLPEFRCK